MIGFDIDRHWPWWKELTTKTCSKRPCRQFVLPSEPHTMDSPAMHGCRQAGGWVMGLALELQVGWRWDRWGNMQICPTARKILAQCDTNLLAPHTNILLQSCALHADAFIFVYAWWLQVIWHYFFYEVFLFVCLFLSYFYCDINILKLNISLTTQLFYIL